MSNQKAKAITFRQMHQIQPLQLLQSSQLAQHDASPLVLPNAWDAASAAIFYKAGFRAIATTSSGVASMSNCWIPYKNFTYRS